MPPLRPLLRLLSIPLLLSTACDRGTSGAEATVLPQPVPVRVQPARLRTQERSLIVVGIVEAESRIELGFRTSGFIAHFHVEEGERVATGEAIAELDLADLERERALQQAALQRAEARAADARLSFTRQAGMRRSKATSQQSYDQARLALEAARADSQHARLLLEAAEDRHAKGTLISPVHAYLERRLAEPHEFRKSGEPVVVLSQLDRVKVRAAVSDSALVRLRLGAPAIVRSPASPEREMPATVTLIDVAADRETRTIPFEVTLENPGLALRPEQVVQVEIPAGDPKQVLAVPLAAVLRDVDGVPFCFVAVADGDGHRVERRPLRIGNVHGQELGILAGLAADERVIVQGQQFLRVNDPVRVVSE